MDNVQLAALKRKHAATREPAKRNELAAQLRAAGHDPDAVETVSVAPKSREVPKMHVTVEAPKVTAAVTSDFMPGNAKEEDKEVAAEVATPRRRPGRPRKTETIE